MTQKTSAILNGSNARCMSRITGKTTHEEVSVIAHTQTYNLVQTVGVRRFQRLGHILRMKGDRFVKLAVSVQFDKVIRGNMFMNTSEVNSFEELERLATDSRQ